MKQRLLKKHRDVMVQMDADERVEKLDETVRNVEEGYEVLLKAFAEREERRERKRAKGEKKRKAEEENGQAGKDKDRSKRKYILIEDSDVEETPKSVKSAKSEKSEQPAKNRVDGGVVE